VGTALASLVGTLIMALWANLPIALAPGMGTNVVFAQIIVVKMGLSCPTALMLVVVSALLFLFLAVTRLREKIVAGFPESIRVGMQCGIGLLIAYIGLNNGGVISHAGGALAFGSLSDGRVLLALVGLVLTPALVALRLPAALLLSIVLIAVAGLFVHGLDGQALTRLPRQWVQMPNVSTGLIIWPDARGYFTHLRSLAPVTLYFLLSAFFSTTATLIAVTRRAGLADSEGKIPASVRPMPPMGSPRCPAPCWACRPWAPMRIGHRRRGGRAHRACRCRGCRHVRPVAVLLAGHRRHSGGGHHPALVIVGLLMMEGVLDLRTDQPEDFAPAIIILLITVTTSDLMMGMALGCFVYTAIVIARRQWQRLTAMVVVIDVIFVAYMALSTTIG
jgi:AGZA family xanthine/uracil permease-like MFS transporter